MRTIPAILSVIPLLLSALFLATYQLAQPPQALRPRVFVIGLSKTGTTSIGDALELIGYRRLGWRDIRSRHMVYTWANGDITPLIEMTRHYDAFEDLPWPLVYTEMAQLYPDAKFILSLRKDETTWLRSMERHVGRGRWAPYTYFYGADTYHGHEDIIRASYRNHTERVRAFFADQPHDYIEMVIDDGDVNWQVLCDFTGQCPSTLRTPTFGFGFPKANTAASWDLGFVPNGVQWLWGWTVTRLEEQSAFYYYESGSQLLRPILSALWKVYNVIEQAYSELYFLVLPFLYDPLANHSAAKLVES